MEDTFRKLRGRIPERRSKPYYYNQNPSPIFSDNYIQNLYPHLNWNLIRRSAPVSDQRNEGFPSSFKPKDVVSIPVKVFDSEKKVAMDENTAAVKVQKVFRGFWVRKSVPLKNLKIIAKVKAEGEEIRKRISDEKVVELVKRDEKERLRILERIMTLLLKLDAIQGVNSVVRESRKAATRELVNLQETVDAIIAGKPMEEEMHEDDTVCSHTEDEPDVLNKSEETSALECLHDNSGEEIKDENPKEVEFVDVSELRDSIPSEMQAEEPLPTQMHDLQLEDSHEPEEFCTCQGADDNVDLENVKRNVSGSDNGLSAGMLETETVQDHENIKVEDDNLEYEVVDATGTGDVLSTREEATEDIGIVREENKRLKTMVADLLKKSEMQSEIIDNLSSRMVQLEEQVSNQKQIAEQRKKTRAVTDVASQIPACDESDNGNITLTDEGMPQPPERRRKSKTNRHVNGVKEDWF